MFYDWIKAFHLIAVISWMAGLFYLPRLFVYHVECGAGTPQAETFKVMEKKLLRIIMNPAMILTWVFGVGLIIMQPGWLSVGWMHLKLLCVVLMSVFHMALSRWRRRMEQDQIDHTGKFFRYMNEVPTGLMIIIVIMVIVRPF